jgi:hypothetical protein
MRTQTKVGELVNNHKIISAEFKFEYLGYYIEMHFNRFNMKIFITILLILSIMSVETLAQKTKTVKIWSKPLTGEVINANYHFDEDGELIGLNIHFMAKDSRYEQLIEYITVFQGAPSDFYIFLKKLEDFAKNEEPGTSMKIDGRNVSYSKLMGTKMINVYEYDSNGYTTFLPKNISTFMSKFIEWCKKNSVIYE